MALAFDWLQTCQFDVVPDPIRHRLTGHFDVAAEPFVHSREFRQLDVWDIVLHDRLPLFEAKASPTIRAATKVKLRCQTFHCTATTQIVAVSPTGPPPRSSTEPLRCVYSTAAGIFEADISD
jgi:hypothetical protein